MATGVNYIDMVPHWNYTPRTAIYKKRQPYLILPNDQRFKDFCIDDLARYDIPNSVEFFLQFTGITKISSRI